MNMVAGCRTAPIRCWSQFSRLEWQTQLSTSSHVVSREKRFSSKTRWRYPRLWYYTAFGGVVCFLGYSLQSRAHCRHGSSSSSVSQLTLYQYATCPYCCKTRAFLDYYRIPYAVVEVNPLFRRELKFSSYRKVPFVLGNDVQVNGSSLIVSVVRTCMLNKELSLSQCLDLYPEISTTDSKGKPLIERANQYFVMLQDAACTDEMSLAEKREEREWRQWVDDELVHTLPPNIYRTPSEALRSFNYISSAGNFNALERFSAKYAGALSMYLLSNLVLKKRYKLKADVRESLYDCCNQWTKAVGGRKFLGGESPNLADLAVYGVLSSTERMDVFEDIMCHTQIGPWYRAVRKAVVANLH